MSQAPAPGSSNKPTEVWSAGEFVVEKICGKRFNHGRPELLVKWMGFPDQDNSWEPLENLGNCIEMVCDFEAELFIKTCGKNKNLTVTGARNVLNLSPKPLIATRSTFVAEQKQKNLQVVSNGHNPVTAPVRTAKRKHESPKKRRQSTASSISSQSLTKSLCSSSKSPTKVAPPLPVTLLNDLDLSEQSDEEDLACGPQTQPTLRPPMSDILRNSVDPVQESSAKTAGPRERNLSSSSSSSSASSSTGSESDSTQTSKSSDTSGTSKTSSTPQASLAPPPALKYLPPPEKSPSPLKLVPSSPKTENENDDLLSSLKKKARQWDMSNRVVKMGGFLGAGMFKPVNDVTNESVKMEPPSPSIRVKNNEYLIPKEEPIGSTLNRVRIKYSQENQTSGLVYKYY